MDMDVYTIGGVIVLLIVISIMIAGIVMAAIDSKTGKTASSTTKKSTYRNY